MRTTESLLKTRVNAGLYRLSGNFKDDITATEYNIRNFNDGSEQPSYSYMKRGDEKSSNEFKDNCEMIQCHMNRHQESKEKCEH
jgi:hypothetical protein